MMQFRCVTELGDAIEDSVSLAYYRRDMSASLPPEVSIARDVHFAKQKLPLRDAFVSLLCAFSASLFVSLSHVVVKKMSYVTTSQTSLIRNSAMIAFCLPLVAGFWVSPFGLPSLKLLIFARGFFNSVANILNLFAYRALPMTIATVILATVPSVVAILAKVWLDEPCGLVQVFALLLSSVGTVLAVQVQDIVQGERMGDNTTATTYGLGVMAAVTCVCLLSFCFASLRLLQGVHCSVLVLCIGCFGFMENAVYRLLVDHYTLPHCGLGRWGMVLIGLLGFLGEMFLTTAIQSEAVGLVIMVKASSDIILAMILQVVFFNDIPDGYSILGGILVLVSVSVIGLRKWICTLDPHLPFRRKVEFLLL